MLVFSVLFFGRALRDPAHPGHPPVQSGGLRLRRRGTSPSTPPRRSSSNTNWQYYGGETTLSYFSQMAGLAVQNFVSAAVGMAVLAAVIRGFAPAAASARQLLAGRHPHAALHPGSALVRRRADLLVSQGVIQTPGRLREPTPPSPAASRRWRSARPPRRSRSSSSAPTAAASSTSTRRSRSRTRPRSRTSSRCCFILLIPAALTSTFGRMVGNRRQGWALYAAMRSCSWSRSASPTPPSRTARRRRRRPGSSSPPTTAPPAATSRARSSATGSPPSAEWAAATTAASNGSVNSAHDSYTGIGGAVPLANMMTGEVIFGGVGSGLYGMLLFVLLAVFIAGLMVGPHARVPRQEDRGARGEAGR